LAQRDARGARPLLNFFILLKGFQRLGYFPNLRDVPESIKAYLRGCLELPQDQSEQRQVNWPGRSLYRYHAVIRSYLKVKVYDEVAEKLITQVILETALTKSNPADLINIAIEILIKESYELRAFSTLDHLVQRVRTQVNNQFCTKVMDCLLHEDRLRLDAMLTTSIAKVNPTTPTTYYFD
jgi:hypothetical protein